MLVVILFWMWWQESEEGLNASSANAQALERANGRFSEDQH
jgi:hypothetical protein